MWLKSYYEIIDNGFQGEGIAKIDGLAIFIPNAIIGEKVKIKIGCAMPLVSNESCEIRGRDLITGLPKITQIDSEQVLK